MSARLTPEQYGAAEGWRLLDDDEKGIAPFGEYPSLYEIQKWEYSRWDGTGWQGSFRNNHYRTMLSRAALRAKRGLSPEPVKSPDVWRRSTDSTPQRCHLPFLLKRKRSIDPILFTDSLPLEDDGYLWYPLQLPAMPEPTTAEKDEAAADSYVKAVSWPNGEVESSIEEAYIAGIAYGRANPA
jgi:hypothetical protein